MLERFREGWRELKRGEPGRRFQEHYAHRHEGGGSTGRKVGFIGAGLAIVAAGIFFLPAPGPGMVVIVIGLGLLAEESARAARLLDWGEEKGRAALARVRDAWRGAGLALRAGMVLVAIALVGGLGFVGYWLFFG